MNKTEFVEIDRKEYNRIKSNLKISSYGVQVQDKPETLLKNSRTLSGHKFRVPENQTLYKVDKGFFYLSRTEISKAGLSGRSAPIKSLEGF